MMMGPMYGFGYGNNASWLWMFAFSALRILLVLGAIILVMRYFRRNDIFQGSGRAIEILKEKYAAGEISEEEYERKLRKLKE